MITWRNLAYDLKLLSSNALGYPLFYILGFGAYLIQIDAGATNDVAAPLSALSLCVLTHISSERADRVADQIMVEHGGRRRRLITRMVSVFSMNVCLVAVGTEIIAAIHGWKLQLPPLWIPTALAVIAIFGSAGVVVAAALPHPILSLALTSFLLFAGGTDLETNVFSRSLNRMILSKSGALWVPEFLAFAVPWLALAVLVAPLAAGRINLRSPHTKVSKRRIDIRIPTWIAKRPTSLQVALRQFTTNPMPALGVLSAMIFYTLGTIGLANRIAELNLQANYVPAFAGLILVNAIPTVMLGLSIQRREVDEQESFLYSSRRRARLARTIQTGFVVFISASVALLWIASITKAGLDINHIIRILIVVAALTPALANVGIKLVTLIRTPLLLPLISYALTLPEVAIAWLTPGASNWLPSSLIAMAAGGPGAYIQPGSQLPPEWISFAFVGLIAASAYPIRRKVSAWHSRNIREGSHG